jgi:manganese-dependent ADP-ribose/CDP-alcohol diphosphatase
MRMLFAILSIICLTAIMPGRSSDTESVKSDQSQPLFAFGVFTDAHYCDCDPSETRFYRQSLSKLRQAVTFFRANRADFIINLGDLIEKDYQSYMPVMHILDSSSIKVYHVTGNHDYEVDHKFFKHLPQLEEYNSGYYSIIHQGFRFIFLNGNEISTYSTHNKKIISAAEDMIASLNKMGEPNGKERNGGIGADQMVWLDDQLNQASAVNQKVFICCHYPVWPINEHNLLNYKDVLSILEKHHNIIAWFNGHYHAGNYGNFNMTHFITFKAMIETETNSFSMVEVYRNKIWIKGEGREKSQILAY